MQGKSEIQIPLELQEMLRKLVFSQALSAELPNKNIAKTS